MRPIIKWPGGKKRELGHISHLISQHDVGRYIEPFVGGGAVFFHVASTRSLINDKDKKLIQFYQAVKDQDPDFLAGLDAIRSDWEVTEVTADGLTDKFTTALTRLRSNDKCNSRKDELDGIKEIATRLVDEVLTDSIEYKLGTQAMFSSYLIDSVRSKLSRVLKLEEKHQMRFSDQQLADHAHTAVKAAYYTLARDEPIADDLSTETAIFYFIREFCYGSMFRFNKDGKFNIPYGGIAYNKKDFGAKVDRLRSPEVTALMERTVISNLDFEEFLRDVQPTKDDFVFLDPPYDSDFKDYGKNPFGKDDHKRLACVFADLESPSVMIIKHTEFIGSLYDEVKDANRQVTIAEFAKQYTYNVRGRNARDATHLVIHKP